MSEAPAAARQAEPQLPPELRERRFIGVKETFGYTLFKASQEFNINKYSDRFIFDVLKIDFYYLSIVTAVGGVWDVINDMLIGTIVDKTRTRWGKFKPYLIAFAIPGTIGTCLYWMMPLLFPNKSAMDFSKFLMYFALAIGRETAGTFSGIAQTGMLATITPDPMDRTRLITISNVLAGFLGDQIPEFLMTLLIDAINMKKIALKMQSTYVFMGLFTTIVGGAAAFYFFIIGKERVMQSIERPSVLQGLKSIINNRPVLLMTLSDFLGSFSISTGMSNYYIDVLGMASIKLIVGIPGGFVSTPSFAWVPWARRHFSTKTLWLVGSYTGDFLMALVFLFGSIGGIKNGLYKRRLPMIIAIMIQETLFMFVFGIRRVIPQEMYNEAMDYCEWKNGYRTEGMTSVARGLASKLVSVFGSSLRSLLMKGFGYVQGAGYLKQSDRTKYFLFAMSTVIPFVTGSLGIIPKLFYNLTGKRKEMMYADLAARRAKVSKEASAGDAESIAKAAEAQKHLEK
ncbi:MAG TPA: MFS transporter [Clostridiales bacterium]|nr:MFS transporter [Clostridiales bacterium]HQK74060.1 MFS transporter [Clostridiales bacterium]